MNVAIRKFESGPGERTIELREVGDFTIVARSEGERQSKISGYAMGKRQSVEGLFVDPEAPLGSNSRRLLVRGPTTEPIVLCLAAPYGTPVRIINCEGTVRMGSTLASLKIISKKGPLDVVARNIGMLQIISESEINIRIRSITQQLKVVMLGEGSVEIEQGQVEHSFAVVGHGGRLSFRGSPGNSTMTTLGNGEIEITQKPSVWPTSDIT